MLAIQSENNTEKFKPLTASKRELLAIQLQNCKLIIIDELSMCSSLLLTQMHFRLQEIACNHLLFGGFNIITFGDLLQLPPVNANSVFQSLTHSEIKKVLDSDFEIKSPLWNHFTYFELTTNVRQANDENFFLLLNRMRVQALTDSDMQILQSRVVLSSSEYNAPSAFVKTWSSAVDNGVAQTLRSAIQLFVYHLLLFN